MRRTAAGLLLIAGLLPVDLASVVVAQEAADSSSDNGSALIDQSTLPTAIESKGSRPQADPSVMPAAATTLPENLDALQAPPSLALPDQTDQVRIRELRPLTLAEVEQLAEINNPQLKAVGLQVQQAKASLRAAIASWYPTLNLRATGLPQYLASERNSFREGQEGQLSQRDRTSANFTAQLNWNLIDPARVPQISAARDTFEKSRDTYLIVLRQLRLDVARAYYDLQRFDNQLNVGKASVVASLVSLRQARARFQAGVATKLEVLEAETQLSGDRDLLTNALRRQSQARRNLAKITNLPQDVTPTAASPSRVVGLWEPSLQESIIAAYAFREELDRFILDISINNSNANAALAAVQPVLGIYNNFKTDRTEGNDFGAPNPNFYQFGWENTVGVSATWKIFDGGRALAGYRRNKLRAEESVYQFANQRDAIRFEVEQSFYNLKANQQTMRTASRAVISQREALRLARLRFQAGVTTQREVVENQRDLTRAQQTYVNAVADYNINIAQLRRYTGLDQVVSCPGLDLPADKPEPSASEVVPIEPSPIIPACEASLLGS